MRRMDTSKRARRAARCLFVLFAAVLGLPALLGSASAQTISPAAPAKRSGISVVQVDGLIDPPNATLIERSVRNAEQSNAMLLVFQLNSGGAVDVDVDHLASLISHATVPVAVWVGPSGANARGGAAVLAFAAPVLSIAQGGGIGPVEPVRLDGKGNPTREELAKRISDAQAAAGRSSSLVNEVLSHRVPAQRASLQHLVNSASPTIVTFIGSVNNTTVRTASGPVKLSTTRVTGTGSNRRQQPNQVVSFGKLDLAGQVQHTLGTPWIAYFLFVVGGALLVFEFFTVSIGIAGAVGAVAVVGACYGFSHLPVEGYAVALLIIAMVGFAIDVQATALGAWTFIGSAALVAGSLTIYGGSSRLDPPWWVLLIVIVGTVVFMLSGMTAMVRSRFSTPTIGREDLIGELGAAEVNVDPDGVVKVRDALWRARTNRATPIEAGDVVRVVAVEGVLLEVEPESGGARDYREPRSKRS